MMRKIFTAALGALLCASFTLNSANAMTVAEELGWSGYDDSDRGAGSWDANIPTCGSGTKVQCGTRTVTKCVEWERVSFTFGVGPNAANAGYTLVCKTTVTSTIILFWDP